MDPKIQPIASSVNPGTTEEFKLEIVEDIISKRKKSALHGAIVVIIASVAISLLDSSINTWIPIIVAALLTPLLLAIYALNVKNSKQLQPSYRGWNTWIYNYGSKLLIITSVLRIFSNAKDLANPLHGFKDPDALSKSALLSETAIEAGIGVVAYANLKPAAYIEGYFKQLESYKKKESRDYQHTQRTNDANHPETVPEPEDSDQSVQL